MKKTILIAFAVSIALVLVIVLVVARSTERGGAAPAPAAKPTEELALVSLTMRVVESNDQWTKLSYTLTVHNNSDEDKKFGGTIQFVDAGGISVSEVAASERLARAHSNETVIGYDLVETKLAKRVDNVRAVMNWN